MDFTILKFENDSRHSIAKSKQLQSNGFFLYKIMNFYQSRALLRQLIVNKIKGSPLIKSCIRSKRNCLVLCIIEIMETKKTIVKMLFSKDSQRLCLMKKYSARFTIERKAALRF
jgi:hypothetical protein